jgi:NAD(P)-dependent dehydrogenase (short-subunit alcohol dehydrogenase family)
MLMQGRRCLITGATSGIGRYTAQELAGLGAEVIIVSRDEEKCQQTVKEIQSTTGNQALNYFRTDLSSQNEIRELADAVKNKYNRLDVLINNAGSFVWRRQESVDGIEMTFALNHLNYFLITNLLMDLLRESISARIINTSSGSHSSADLDFNDLQLSKNYLHFAAYGKSKLANIYFTYELARRLKDSRITVNAFNPGFTATNMAREGSLIGKLFMPLTRLFAIPVDKGAETLIFLASSEEVEGISGKYFQEKKAIQSSPLSYDHEIAARLWEISEELTGLK